MRKALALVMGLSLMLFVTACGDGGKAAADAAIKAAETAFAAVTAEAAQYVPDQQKVVADAIAAAKDAFAQGNFQQALTDANALTAKIDALKAAADAKKAEVTRSWEALSTGLPQVVTAITERMDILGKAKKLPATLSQEAYDGAKAGLDTVNQTWAAAQDAFKAGNLMDAVAKAGTVKTEAAKIMTALGMELPPALQ